MAAPFDPQQDTSPPPASTAPVAAACLACRSRHLKCDAGIPICQRCHENNRECVYVKSRRGWKGTSSKDSGQMNTPGPAFTGTAKRRIESEVDSSFDPYSTGQSVVASSSLSPLASSGQKNALPLLVDLFYYHFHNSHPVMVPRQFYGLLLSSSFNAETTELINNLLLPVVHYIGSIYIRNANRGLYRYAVEKAIFGDAGTPGSPNRQYQFIIPPSPVAVMALLLYAIVIHGENEQEKSMVIKNHAVDMALFIHMHDNSFIDTYLDNSYFNQEPVFLNVLKESLRRTYWMLLVMDGWMNALHRKPPSKLAGIVSSMDLPCEDDEYNAGNIPVGHTLQEFDDRIFADSPAKFSSFSYLIDAIRIMTIVIASLATQTSETAVAELADTSTSVWLLHIPEAKKTLLRPVPDRHEYLGLNDTRGFQEVDELMLHAYIVINNFLILVHKPLSRLAMVPSEYEEHESHCVTPRSLLISFRAIALARDGHGNDYVPGPLESNSMDVHTVKCMTSADMLSRLISLSPGTVGRRSPFFTCTVTLALLVQLTACVWVFYEPSAQKQRAMAKERIKVGVGALRAMGEIWSTAHHVVGQIKEAARIVFDQHRSADKFLRDVANASKRRKTVRSTASGVMNAELQFGLNEPSSNSIIMPSDRDTMVPNSSKATDQLQLDWSYIPTMDSSSASSAGDNYSTASSSTGYSPSMNLDSSVLYPGSQGPSPEQQLSEVQAFSTLSDLDREVLQNISALPEPLISEDELFRLFNEPGLVDTYKQTPPAQISDSEYV
ncbi:hypothetical protein V1517DRAFT_322633 [Lipomyces orientalis]|uniref:Uncharacterized protein n=1 Tax=Lipomyces orientalis TaxID=1233043 RepID=A0ACC3TP93_9ASCO